MYIDQRDKELFRAFCKAKAEQLKNNQKITLPEAIEMARTTPTSRYFVSEHRASLIIKKIKKGLDWATNMNYTKIRMFKHLYMQYEMLRIEYPNDTHEELVTMACACPAQEFYLTQKTATDLLSHIHCNHIASGVFSSNQSLIKERRANK